MRPPTPTDIRHPVLARGFVLVLVASALLLPGTTPGEGIGHRAAHPPPPPASAPGYPSRAPDLDALPGFRNPPPGYGEVPFWWWTGDPLDRDRLLWQIEELHRLGIAGVQVNYAHEDTPGWPTYASEPAIFSEAWWDIWSFVAAECGKRDMGVGLSGYTLDWPNGRSLVSRTVYSEPELVGRELRVASRTRVEGGATASVELPSDAFEVRAYPINEGRIGGTGESIAIPGGTNRLAWTSPPGTEREIWVLAARAKAGSLNPMHPEAGRRVIAKFFQRFQDHARDGTSRGLNYFFHDELQFGVSDPIWTSDLPERFRERKGYDFFETIPALFGEAGPRTAKHRLDYHAVRMELVQERYFAPIFAWHWSRGMIYGCDQGSRGRDPTEFGDYFSAVRWYTAPGHDTPGGRADLIKGKVSSSIGHLYGRPRVWLEGYHSLGWGATPARLMEATCENYLYGCNLLNLHGLYYSTHGSHWEWAPPCYHFRMPYWRHMGTFLRYFERLSYLLSQGVHRCDIAVLYPVTPGQAGLGGKEATEMAFEVGEGLFRRGRDFIYLDDDSLDRARIENGRLVVSDASYRVLVLPAMRAVRWSTLEKARDFRRGGGWVIAVGSLPEASDRAGAEDPAVDAIVREVFGAASRESRAATPPSPSVHPSGGLGIALAHDGQLWNRLPEVLGPIPRDVISDAPVAAVHRRVGPREVYFVTGAGSGAEVTFRARGRAELWDPWTGESHPIHTAWPDGEGTRVRLPSGPAEARLVVFSPGQAEFSVAACDLAEVRRVEVRGGSPRVMGFADGSGPRKALVHAGDRTFVVRGQSEATRTIALDGEWEFELEPTMNNRWGDFRLPVVETIIGPEARRFRHAEERSPQPGWQAAALDDSAWNSVTHGFGTKLLVLGPLPSDSDPQMLDGYLSGLSRVEPGSTLEVGGRRHAWKAYEFSWRWGKEGDPGHQGYHGLKEQVSDDFLCLGKPTPGHNETVYRTEPGGSRYYVWTTAASRSPGSARALLGGLRPAAMFLNGENVTGHPGELALHDGPNPLLLRYESAGRGHLVLQRTDAGPGRGRTPLAMRWYDEAGIVPFDVRPGEPAPVGWYRFTAPPGLRALTVRAFGQVEAWIDGTPCPVLAEEAPSTPGFRAAATHRVRNPKSSAPGVTVALRIAQVRGEYGGSAIPEPVVLECESGPKRAGDWSTGSVLENYSGGAWYRRTVALEDASSGGRVRLHLGDVAATAEVRWNGQLVGVRVAPPWTFDVSDHVRTGTNRVEILVCNTLANHYQTIPTSYRGSPRSGLIGPVSLEFQPETVLE